MKKLIFMTLTAIVMFTVSCSKSKDDNINPENYLLTRAYTASGDVYKFTYDDKKRISTFINNNAYKIEYTYDQSGNLIQFVRTNTYPDYKGEIYVYVYNVIYSENTITIENNRNMLVPILTLNDKKQIIKINWKSDPNRYGTFTSDNEGNVIKEDFNDSNMFFTSVEYNYDAKRNPLANLESKNSILLSSIGDNRINLFGYYLRCPSLINNLTKEVLKRPDGSTDTINFVFEYNDAGFPTKMTSSNFSDPIKFEYTVK